MKRLLALLMMGTVAAGIPAAWSEPAIPAAQTQPTLQFGQPAPEIDATSPDGKARTLADFRGQPVVVQFGSLTDPIFRMRAPAVEQVAKDFGERVSFLIIYQKEAHPADGSDALEINAADGLALAAPTSLEERSKLANLAVEKLKITHQTMLVDAWNNTSSHRYGGLANMTFVLDAKGNLSAAYPFMDTKKVKGALTDLLAGKPVAEANKGPVRTTPPALTDINPPGVGQPGPVGAMVVLEALNLPDNKRSAILPALAQYTADLRTFREKSGVAPAPKATTAPAATAVTPAVDLTEITAHCRASADKLRTALKDNLPQADYDEVMGLLTKGPAGRFFVEKN